MKEIIVLDGKLYVQERANNIIAKDGVLYAQDFSHDPEDWITINGSHVEIGEGGKIAGGAGGKLNGSVYKGTQKAKHAAQKSGAISSSGGGGMKSSEQHKTELKSAIGAKSDAEAVTHLLSTGKTNSLNDLQNNVRDAERSLSAVKGTEYEKQQQERLNENLGKLKAAEDILNQHIDSQLNAIKQSNPSQYESAKKQADDLRYEYNIGKVRKISVSEGDSQQKKDFADAVEKGEIKIVGNQIGGKTFKHKDFIKQEFGARWNRDTGRWEATKNPAFIMRD